MTAFADGEFNEGLEKDVAFNRVKLPIYEHRTEIIEAVRNHQFVIIHGETGCGKTTQVPQYLLEEGLNGMGTIGVTQPRKITTKCLAARVSFEMGESLGKIVGYEVRFDRKCGASTKIKYMTDGILLNECLLDKNLKNYEIIMIDEAHERTVLTDVLLGILKLIAAKRQDLKVIISSATITVDKFIAYFKDVQVVFVDSSVHHVDVVYHSLEDDYITKAVEVVKQIITDSGSREKGDILIFLMDKDEISKCCEMLEHVSNIVLKPFFGAIDFEKQQEVFSPVEAGKTKVVVATNIAETSITIEGIKYVIDCGYAKQNNFLTKRWLEVVGDTRISKTAAHQRKGRAGRTSSGVCHRLYTEERYEDFEDEFVPEIYRRNLSEVYLKIKSFGIDPNEFNFLDSPELEELERSKNELVDLDLLTVDGELTDIGREVSYLPLHPNMGKVLMTSLNCICTMDVIRIISMFSEKMERIFKRPEKEENRAHIDRSKFYDPDGEHFMALNVYKEWREQADPPGWCLKNNINSYVMETVKKVIDQIQRILTKGNIEAINENPSLNKQDIKKCFISGFFRNICILRKRGVYCRCFQEITFHICGSSKHQLILFNKGVKASKLHASGIMKLDERLLREHFQKELSIIDFPEDIFKDTF